MKLITENPYRIAGTLSNTSEKDLLKQKSKIKRFSEVGKAIISDYDFSFLTPIPRENGNIDKAFSDIEQNQDKVNHALFWFLNVNTFDETAINYLKNGDKEKAIEIWGKITDGKDVSSKNFSAFNNIGTLYFLGNSDQGIKKGIEAKIKLLESEYFKDFAYTVADETFTIDQPKQIEIFVEELLNQFKGNYSNAETMDLFSNCNGAAQKYLSKRFTEGPIHKIEAQIEQTKAKRVKNKENAFRFGKELYQNTKSELALLKQFLGSTNAQYKLLADNVAKEILQCSIDYFNESQENDIDSEYLADAMQLAKLADSVAVNSITKGRIKDSISTLEEMKGRELNQAIEFLSSIKEMYEENERKIRQEVKEMERNDILIQIGHRSINWDAVNENIRNSINWDAVNQMVKEVLADNNLKKIKESDKTEQKAELWELLNWMKDNSSKHATISRIIETYRNIPPKLFFEVLSSEVTNTDSNSNFIEKPFYVEDIRYVGIKLDIRSTGTQKITIYKKYINPDGKYKHSSKDSPEGYSTSANYTIAPLSTTIDLGGYGNSKECTYMVGKHKIEVYVEHYKILTKTFQVDWSPKKKAELTRNLELLQNELKEVEKFKWFRSPETKQKEVKEVQDKIEKARKILMNK